MVRSLYTYMCVLCTHVRLSLALGEGLSAIESAVVSYLVDDVDGEGTSVSYLLSADIP